MPIAETKVKTYYPRLGKITAGYMAAMRLDDGRTVTYPAKTDRWVFRSNDPDVLAAVARVFGGMVTPSPDPEVDRRYTLITHARSLDVLLLSDDYRTWECWMEFWAPNHPTCLRRCNFESCLFVVDPDTGERRESTPDRPLPCLCQERGLTGDAACKPTSRLNVLVPALKDAPGLGIWQIESRGWATQAAIDGMLRYLKATFKTWRRIPLTASIRVVTKHDRTGVLRVFPVIVLSSRRSMKQVMEETKDLDELIADAELPEPDRERPLGAGLTAEQEEASRLAGELRPSSPAAARPAAPAPRDNTEFWTAVRGAAEIEGEDPQDWLRRLTGFETPDELSDDVFQAVLFLARSTVMGRSSPFRKPGTPRRRSVKSNVRTGSTEEQGTES